MSKVNENANNINILAKYIKEAIAKSPIEIPIPPLQSDETEIKYEYTVLEPLEEEIVEIKHLDVDKQPAETLPLTQILNNDPLPQNPLIQDLNSDLPPSVLEDKLILEDNPTNQLENINNSSGFSFIGIIIASIAAIFNKYQTKEEVKKEINEYLTQSKINVEPGKVEELIDQTPNLTAHELGASMRALFENPLVEDASNTVTEENASSTLTGEDAVSSFKCEIM